MIDPSEAEAVVFSEAERNTPLGGCRVYWPSDGPRSVGRYARCMEKSELIRSIREAHQRMAAAIEDISDVQLLEPAMDGWTGKDLVAHMAWWHDHSARVIEELRAGRQPYDRTDPANAMDALNDRVRREHIDDAPATTRRAFRESFTRLLAALEPASHEELFARDRWPWLEGEALVEMILWDSSRHYDAHREHVESISH